MNFDAKIFPGSFAVGLSLILLIALAGFCCGTEQQQPGDLNSLLPGPELRAGFAKELSQTTYNRAKIWDYIGPNADVYLYNGFQNLLVTRYGNGSGDTLTCEIFEFSTPYEAFALYSNLREPSYPYIQVGYEGYLHGDTLTFLKGNILGRFHSQKVTAADWQRAAEEIAARAKGEVKLPGEFQYFPDGYLPHSQRVTLRDFLGQTGLDNFFSMVYLLGGDTATLYLNLQADNTVAQVVHSYMGGTGIIKQMIFDGTTQGFTAENDELGSFLCQSRGRVLVLVVGYGDEAAAKQLVKEVFKKVDQLGMPDTAGATN